MTKFWHDPPMSVGVGYIVAGGLCLLALHAFGDQQWLWGLAHLTVAYVMIRSIRFAITTPIIELSSEELVINRGYFSSQIRVLIRDIRQLDRSRPSRITLEVLGRKDLVIPLGWLRPEDQPRFISALAALVGNWVVSTN